jgi:sugar porter (SP) family MFS transporter
VQQVEKYQGVNPHTGEYVFTAFNQNLLFSVPLVGSIIGALIAPPLNFYYGRKWPLIGLYIVSFGGVFLQLFAGNIASFVMGRFWNSFTFGTANAIAPLYLAEIVPSQFRGRAVASLNIMNLIAGVVATVVVEATHQRKNHLAYQIPLAIQCLMPAILIPLTVFLPESPQWLASKGRMKEARCNLRKIRGFTDAQVDDELRVMKMCEDNERALTAHVRFWNIFNRENLKRTITAGALFSFNQISGVILSTTYATVFLTQIGVGQPFTLTVIASCCVLAGTIAAPFTIDLAGRRPTALVGMTILFIIDIVAGTLAFFMSDRHAAICIAALSFIFNFFWAASFYSLSILLPAEIATPKLRNYTMSYTIAWAQTTAVITTFVVPQLTAADGANLGAKTYLVFAGCMVGVIVFVYFLVPETKGRTFAEIDELYDAKIPMRAWRRAKTTTTAKQATVVPASIFTLVQSNAMSTD